MKKKQIKAVNAKTAYKIMEELGLCWGMDGRTFYASDGTEVWEFDTKQERDIFVARENNAMKVYGNYADGHPQNW